jgi:hypothetical protein
MFSKAGDEIECKTGSTSGERWTMQRSSLRLTICSVSQLKLFIIRDRKMHVVLVRSGSFIVFQPELATDKAKLDKDSACVELKTFDIGSDFLIEQIVHSISQLPR